MLSRGPVYTWQVRLAIFLHQYYVLWACERFINSEAFGSGDVERQEEQLANIPLHAFQEFLGKCATSDSRPTLYHNNNYSTRSQAIHLGYTSARRLEGEHAKALTAAKKKAARAAGDENLEATALKLEETAKRLRSLQRQDSTLAVARGMRRRSSIIGAKTGQAVKLVARDSVTSETLRDVLADIRTHNSEGVGAKTAAAAVCAPHARMVCALAAGVAQGSRGRCHVDAGARAGRDRGPRMV